MPISRSSGARRSPAARARDDDPKLGIDVAERFFRERLERERLVGKLGHGVGVDFAVDLPGAKREQRRDERDEHKAGGENSVPVPGHAAPARYRRRWRPLIFDETGIVDLRTMRARSVIAAAGPRYGFKSGGFRIPNFGHYATRNFLLRAFPSVVRKFPTMGKRARGLVTPPARPSRDACLHSPRHAAGCAAARRGKKPGISTIMCIFYIRFFPNIARFQALRTRIGLFLSRPVHPPSSSLGSCAFRARGR